jgi:uncharacterized protein
MSSRRRTPSASMAKAAMPLKELDQWLRGRTDRQPAATNLSMLDGYVTAIVAGPVSLDPPEWICPLLAIDADAFNHGGTPEFAAISAVAVRHNDIGDILSTAPDRFEPIYRGKPNRDIDARPWCRGFYAAMQLRMSAWNPLINIATSITAYSCLSSCIASTIRGAPCSDRPGRDQRARHSCARHTQTSRPSSKPCVSTGCRSATAGTRDSPDVGPHTGYVVSKPYGASGTSGAKPIESEAARDTRAAGLSSRRDLAAGLVADYAKDHERAVACFMDDFEACIAHLRFPVTHRRAIRTTNLLERLFVEERRRLKIIPNAFGERAVLKLMFGALTRAAERWRSVKVTDFERRQIAAIRKELDEEYEAQLEGCHCCQKSSKMRT